MILELIVFVLYLTRTCCGPVCALVYKVYFTVYTMADNLNFSGNDLDEFSEASDELISWIEELEKTMNCKNEFEFSVEKFMRAK